MRWTTSKETMMHKQVRVNVRSNANVKAVRSEKRNGRDVLVVPSATLPDNVVMNGIRYPADEIAKSFAGLNRTPAPLGHPTVNGKFVSASDPEGINVGYIGAWNENARQEGGRVLLDKVIDIEVAGRTEGGKAVLAAINAGDPIHTSTGLLCRLEPVANGEGFKHDARDIYWDHDALLLNEEGAATPDQGVGIFVNSKGEDIEVINSAIDDAERELDWAGLRLLEAADRLERATVWERMKAAILGALPAERESTQNRKDDDMTVTKEQFDGLSAKVNTLSETLDKLDIAGAVANAIKPLTDNLAEMQTNQKAKDDAELAGHVAAIVKANILDEDSAKELTLNAARKLAERAKPGKAFGLSGAPLTTNADDEFSGVDLNAGMEAK
ncbi:hypothetical protein [Paracoccus liaowanqingii]|uniref:hypothetical protein n=1 Tax=Paracoccus liaowanqingii TaxID=2560053 RepID=UPI001E4D112F|nr:hypothetical protein [Paracoccus liaowanqingii]